MERSTCGDDVVPWSSSWRGTMTRSKCLDAMAGISAAGLYAFSHATISSPGRRAQRCDGRWQSAAPATVPQGLSLVGGELRTSAQAKIRA